MVEVIVVRSHVEHLLYPVAGVEPVTNHLIRLGRVWWLEFDNFLAGARTH